MKLTKRPFFILLAFSIFIITSIQAQNPSKIIDTLKLNNKDVVLFQDNQWMYLDEYSILYADETSELYKKYWETNCIYSYLKEPVKPKFDFSTVDIKNFTMPVKGKFFRGYGKGHAGLDIGLKMGDSVVAAFDGKVRYAQYHAKGYGFLVIIRHSNGLETWYSHLSRLNVSVNQYVSSGQLIGQGGMTGRATAPHLHLEFRYFDTSMDPLKFIDFNKYELTASLLNHKPSEDQQIQEKSIAETKTSNTTIKQKLKTHTIKQGDTLYAISKKFNTSVDEICKLNGIRPNSLIQPGMKIKLPKS